MNTFNYTYRNKTYASVYAAYKAAPEPKFKYNAVVRRFYDKQMTLDVAIHGNRKPADLNLVKTPNLPVVATLTKSWSRRKQVTYNGVVYPSLVKLAGDYDIKYQQLKTALYVSKLSLIDAMKKLGAKSTTVQKTTRAYKNRRKVNFNGVTYASIAHAARELNLNYTSLRKKIYTDKMTPQKAISHSLKNQASNPIATNAAIIVPKKSGRPKRVFTINGQTYHGITEAAQAFGINRLTAMKRLYSFGWTPEKAFTTPTRVFS